MLGVIAYITWRSTQAFINTAASVAQTHQTLEIEEKLLRHLMEMESDRRGFLLTGDEQQLATFERSRLALWESVAELESMIADTPEQAARINRLEKLFGRSRALQQLAIEARRTGDIASAQAAFAAPEAAALQAQIRGVLQEFEDAERAILVERGNRTRWIGRATTAVIVLSAIIALVAVIIAGRLILRDIAARRRAEEALADQHNLLSSIIDAMPDHVYVKDVKGRYILDNRAHRHYLGLAESGGIEGKTVYDFFPKELAELYDADDQKVLESGESMRHREEPGSPDSSVDWLSTTKVPLREANGQILGLVCVSSDITEQKAAEEKLRRSAAQLERSNAELANFASVASHDLQEPLRKIQAFGDRLKVKCSDALGDLGRDYLERMQNAAQRMQVLIQDLLKLSRVTSRAQPFEQCDLAEIARAVVTDLEVAIEQTGARVEVGPLPTIYADCLQMRQLFQNLISNGLKFHRAGEKPEVLVSGKVYPMVDQLPGRTSQAEVCRIIVQDNGIGFDDKFAEQIFVVFQRLHARTEYEGTGIGLAVCRKITDRHGGTIVAKSSDGHGATFIVTLPVTQPANPPDE